MEKCCPLTVEGDWSPAQSKTVKNKLQLHFQNKRKSSGGECRVEVEDGAPRAALHFTSEEVRARVLHKQNHEIVVDGQTIKLRLISDTSSTDTNIVSGSKETQTQRSDVKPGHGAAAANTDASESGHSPAVLLENLPDDMSSDLLSMLVENVSGLEASGYSLEMIPESSTAVVTFSSPADVESFLSRSRTNRNLQRHGLNPRPVEEIKSVRVENLPPSAVKDLLELYFEKSWALPDTITMIPDEDAAIVTFSDAKAVESICAKDHVLSSTAVKVYPYCETLGTALYGKERPTWKMPKPFTETLHPALWKFLLMKKLLEAVSDQMRPSFCRVEFSVDDPEVKLSPLTSFLRQKDLTKERVDSWGSTVQEAFHQQMSQYSTFECPTDTSAWKAAEKDVRSVVQEDVYLEVDESSRTLMVAGRADDIKRVKSPVENILLKAANQIDRQRNGISEEVDLSSGVLYILKQGGLEKAVSGISPDMNVSYSEGTQRLTIAGLPGEVFQLKSWILERNMHMSKKLLNLSPSLLDFLKTADPRDMSQDLFTSQGISAFYSIESKGVFLLGSSDQVLADAERKLKTVLSSDTLDVEDQDVLKLPGWADLNQQLLDSYNSSKKRTLVVQMDPERRDKLTVAGFVNPVNEVSRSLKEFIKNFSRVQETLRVESCAVVQFMDKKKVTDWTSIAQTHDVKVGLDSERPRISISGARVHVLKAKSCFQELIRTFCTDTFTVDKPGAKKYFMSQGSLFLASVMTELNCVVVLRPKNQDQEEEEDCEEEYGLCYCKVKTASGVLVSVSKADICRFTVDAVVNAANEDLQHIGGLALALLRAAGPQLQKVSDDYVAKNGRLRPGDAITTDAFNLPCKFVVHAVGPRFSDSDKKTSVSRLKLAVKESLTQAEMNDCSTIALPAISSGEFGFPLDLCAETIAEAVREYCDSPHSLSSLTEVHLVDNNIKTIRVLAEAVKTEFSDLGPTMMEPAQKDREVDGASGGSKWGRGRGKSKSPKTWGRRKRGRREEGDEDEGRAGLQSGLQSNREHQSPRGNSEAEEAKGSGRMEQTTTEGLKIVLCQGNIQDQTTDVIVNTIGDNMNLSQGAVSKALLEAAGPRLQSTVRSEAKTSRLQFGDVVITKGFELCCQNVFHTVCPNWDNGAGQAEQTLIQIIKHCLDEAEKLQMKSLSIPAIGTGNLGFPRDLVCRVLLREIHSYSRSRSPAHLREVAIVVHPNDRHTVECFTTEFKGQTSQSNIHYEEQDFNESSVPHRKTQQSSAFISPVKSPSLGVYQMQVGQLMFEVSSGDITKETSDAIVNSSNKDFNLKSGVSKAILDSAGPAVEQECSQIVNAPGYKDSPVMVTSAGQLPSKHIVHIGGHDPAKIKEVVYSVLNVCEENKFQSVSFPALGTGQGGVDPSKVAEAMIDAVVDFVKKKQPKFVRFVKILIFQTIMMTEFHKSMKSREGQGLEEKSIITKIRDTFTSFTSFLGFGGEQSNIEALDLEKEEFEPAVFQLCADNNEAASLAKKKIIDLIVAEQATKTITDPYISQLSQDDVEQLKSLQRELTVSISLDKGLEGQEPNIHLEGLTRDVFTAESAIRNIIQKLERSENLKTKASYVSGLVRWEYSQSDGEMRPFDIYTNLQLEEALKKKQSVEIKINNKTYVANVMLEKAVRENKEHKALKLHRKELKDDAALPEHWDDMKGDLLKLFPLTPGSTEYKDVETEMTKTTLTANIISIERVQNLTLWKSYELMKKELEKKNQHTNNEKRLFHGTTSKAIDFINKQGFNRSYAGTEVGTKFGKGSYFAVDPVYSSSYATPDTTKHKRMYVAKVLVGDFTQGNPDMIIPPSKNSGKAADLYDSVTDNPANPTMFVVFSDMQAYPEYLITFT